MAAARPAIVPRLVAGSFRGGIDRRRGPFDVSEALWDALNVHITPGGEVEKRLGMALVSALPSGTMGLHVVGDWIYVFGSDPEPSGFPIVTPYGNIRYQRLTYPGAPAMTRFIKAVNYAGLVYAIAEFGGDGVKHFYDGVLVSDWVTISEPVTSNSAVLSKLKDALDATGLYGTVTVAGSTIVVEASDEEEHSASASVEHLGAPTDGDIALTSTVLPVKTVIGVEATGIITFVSRGSSGTRQLTKIEVEVDSLVDLLNGVPQVWASGDAPETFAEQVKTAINAATSVHGWTATRVGNSVWFSPAAGTYEGGNGINCYYTKENIQIAQPKAPSVGYVTQGGKNPVTGNPASFTFTISGTFSELAVYTIEIDGARYSVRGYDLDPASTAIVHRGRVIAPTDTMIYLSSLRNPRKWLSGIGYGYIDVESQSPDGDPITALSTFGQRLAVFQKRSVQIWDIPADENQSALLGMVQSVGCLGPNAVVDLGGIDTIFLSNAGVRSLRARTLTDAPFVQDIGSPIDQLLSNDIGAGGGFDLTADMKAGARAVVNPTDGRVWFVFGTDTYQHIVFVLSHYTGQGREVRAWTKYRLPFGPEHIATSSKYLFVRSGDFIYAYGGVDGTQHVEDGSTTYEIITPYYSMAGLGMAIGAAGVTASCTGEWGLSVYSWGDQPYIAYSELGTVGPRSRTIAPFRMGAHQAAFAFRFLSGEKSAGSLSQIMLVGHPAIH